MFVGNIVDSRSQRNQNPETTHENTKNVSEIDDVNPGIFPQTEVLLEHFDEVQADDMQDSNWWQDFCVASGGSFTAPDMLHLVG